MLEQQAVSNIIDFLRADDSQLVKEAARAVTILAEHRGSYLTQSVFWNLTNVYMITENIRESLVQQGTAQKLIELLKNSKGAVLEEVLNAIGEITRRGEPDRQYA